MSEQKDNPEELAPEAILFGEPLQQERLRQGISLEKVAQATGISITNLTALEESDRHKLPADVFNRGFIKIYGNFLNFAPDECLTRYERAWGFSNGIAGDHSYLTGSKMAERVSILEDRQSLIFIGIALVVAAIFLIIQFMPKLNERHNIVTQPKYASTTQEANCTKSVQDKPISAYNLTAEFSQRTWFKLASDEDKAAEYTFRAHDNHSWQANEIFRIQIGNPKGVKLFLNGEQVEIDHNSTEAIDLELP